MKKYIFGIFAAVFGIVLAFGTSGFKSHPVKNHPLTDYYYEFTGIHGQESTMSLWVQLASENDYEDLNCTSGSNNSCKIINNTNAGTHPTSVPLNGSGFPKLGTVTHF
jgi:hypothetical protein